MTDWLSSLPPGEPAPKELTLEELKRLKEQVTTGAAFPLPPCKVCKKLIGEILVPGDGFYCRWHKPGDVEVIE